ncbi:hypothetical protein [Sphingobacterium siyangense]|uniref:DUF5045 domain-containing protein n=1 Tax=Sphingobacterium siyangense TaxID=459529 RepID=A0A562M6W7_9SPHI|nr:hypothetical protein [Sphingobacterium siyangense]TWI15685.1 hypothetical protein IQ31_04968 [Sphingobacterium siyangense]
MWRNLTIVIILLGARSVYGQRVKRQTDKHIINQQERMVHKQWDRKKFTPTSGFLGLNYQYWLTWGLHPNYPKLDRRPLSGSGPQTMRMGLVLAMQNTSNSYKKQSDTIRNTALKELARYSGFTSEADPLWILYYKNEFNALEKDGSAILEGLNSEIKAYLVNKGVYEWYLNESAELKERLEALRNTDLERGSRIMGYHRLLAEYRALESAWESKRSNALKFLSISKGLSSVKDTDRVISLPNSGQSDVEIANRILKKNR